MTIGNLPKSARTGILQWLLLLSLLVMVSPAMARDISPQRECATCHVMWLSEFQREGAVPLIDYDPKPVVETGRQDAASTDRMCFSCHDGFVLDSRFVWADREHFHPVGVVPSDDIYIPTADGKEIFPLNEDGKIYCGTCHSAHGVEWGMERISPVFLRVENVDSSLCFACHLERGTGTDEGNHPVFREIDKLPNLDAPPQHLHELGAKFGRDGTVICQSCHRVHGARDEKLLMVDNSNSALCSTCHDDRYVSGMHEAQARHTHPVNIVPERAEVPDALLGLGAKLGEGGTVICQSCHKPHHAEAGPKILVKRNEDAQLCVQCHAAQAAVQDTRHDMRHAAEAGANIRGQTSHEGGVCSACHVPHRGSGPKMWARELADDADPMAATCLSCHQEGEIAGKKLPGRHTHPVGRPMGGINQDSGLPAFDSHGLRTDGGEGWVSCASCHDPHQWSPDGKTTDPRRGSGDGSSSFLRKDNTRDSALCTSCHRQQKALLGTPHDRTRMERHASLPADTSGVCDTCHKAHQGHGPRMWAMQAAGDADPVSALCLSCHHDEGVAHGKTVGQYTHPVDVPLERVGIRPGANGWQAQVDNLFETDKPVALPLFDTSARKAISGGRVSCATCHDVHRHQPVAGASGEGRFLRLPVEGEAKLCRNCHVDKGMVSLSKHNLDISRPDEAEAAHVCAQCHQPHNAEGVRLWANRQGEGSDPVSALCLGCHQDGAMAEGKQVGEYTHPLGVTPQGGVAAGRLPLFDHAGQVDVQRGGVGCASCHNPHQWEPGAPHSRTGASATAEGDGSNSFLRLPSVPDSQLCTSCHQREQWVRNTEHDLRITAPHEQNASGQTVAESGVCGQCHAVHNAEMSSRLWGRDTGQGQDIMEDLCLGCHSPGKVAQDKVPGRLSHPKDVPVSSVQGWPRPGQVAGHYPVYDAEGNVANSGVISCPTCHNPHQWQPEVEQEGPGRNVEGNALNSFLRNKSNFNLCTNCHGMDALYRYKYFHGEGSRQPHQLFR